MRVCATYISHHHFIFSLVLRNTRHVVRPSQRWRRHGQTADIFDFSSASFSYLLSSVGATIRIYFEKYEADPSKLEQETAVLFTCLNAVRACHS